MPRRRPKIYARRRRTQIYRFKGKKRRKSRVSKRLKRAIKRIAFSDNQVRWADISRVNTKQIKLLSNTTDHATIASRTGVIIRPLYDMGGGATGTGIPVGTGFANRQGDSVYLLGCKLQLYFGTYQDVANYNLMYNVRMVWGFKHPDSTLATEHLIHATELYSRSSAPGGAGGINDAIMPWPHNKQATGSGYAHRKRYHITGSRLFQVSEGSTGGQGSGHREVWLNWNWKIHKKITFETNQNNPDQDHSKMEPFILIYTDRDGNGTTTGCYATYDMRVYFKQMD